MKCVPKGAGWAGAGVRNARPAAQAQHSGDVGRSLAPAITQVEQAEPERDDAPDRVGVVAALVTPLLVSRMRRGPVEFRAHPVFLVEVVEVLVPGTLPDPHLAASGGQPVRAFHPMHVAVFQHGQDAIPGITQRQDELTAPAHLLAGIHGLAYPVGRGAPAADGPADPRVRVVEGRRDLDQVEHRVLDPGTWREHGRVPGPQDRVRPVDDDAGNLRPRRVLDAGNRDDDERSSARRSGRAARLPSGGSGPHRDRRGAGRPRAPSPGRAPRRRWHRRRVAAAASGHCAPGCASSTASMPASATLTAGDGASLELQRSVTRRHSVGMRLSVQGNPVQASPDARTCG